jgi:hypothetical protein
MTTLAVPAVQLGAKTMTDTTPTCRAPGHRCVDMRDCYTSKGCQYQPDDSGVVFLEPTAADLAPFNRRPYTDRDLVP